MRLRNVAEEVRRHGAFRTIASALLRVINRYAYLRVFCGIVIESPDPTFLSCDPAYHGMFVPAPRLRTLSTDPVNELDTSFLDGALAKGDECYGFFAGDALAAYGWYTKASHAVKSTDFAITFDPRYMYMYKGFTHPAHRGKRLHAVGMTRALEAYLARGYRGLLSDVEWQNSDSLKSCFRMGYRAFGNVYIARVFGRYRGRADARCGALQFALRRTG